MSNWVEKIRSASFRGVTFHVVESPEIEVGRRTADHEYAGREEPYSEDMGRKQRSYTIEGAVYGNDFIAQANRLQDAFEAYGAGLLIHPHYGELYVTCEARIKYEGRYASFSATFKEAGHNDNPGNRIDTGHRITDAAIFTQASAISDFVDKFDLSGPAFITEASLSDFTTAFESIGGLVGDFTNLIHQPKSLGERLFSSVGSLKSGQSSQISAISSIGSLVKTLSAEPSLVTPSQQKIESNKQALQLLVNQAAVTSMATALIDINFTNQAEAKTTSEQVASHIDEVSWTSSDHSFQALTDLRINVQQDMQYRLPKLPDVTLVSLPQTTPALVIAYRHTGTIDTEQQLIERNNILRPGFVSGEVEIINV